MSKNTEVTVHYRDAANYKQNKVLVVEGGFPESLGEAVASAKVDGEFIDLAKTTYGSICGMFPEINYDNEIDHDYVTLEFAATDNEADMTQQQFADMFGLPWTQEVEHVNVQKPTGPLPSM